jgi:hypothetical protein
VSKGVDMSPMILACLAVVIAGVGFMVVRSKRS